MYEVTWILKGKGKQTLKELRQMWVTPSDEFRGPGSTAFPLQEGFLEADWDNSRRQRTGFLQLHRFPVDLLPVSHGFSTLQLDKIEFLAHMGWLLLFCFALTLQNADNRPDFITLPEGKVPHLPLP